MTWRALDAGVSAVKPRNGLHNGEPQTGLRSSAGAGRVDAVETIEDATQVLFRDADAGVGYASATPCGFRLL